MFDRRKHWGDVYQEKSPSEVSWYQKEPKLSLELIRSTNVVSNEAIIDVGGGTSCLLYTSPSPRDKRQSRMPSSA